MPHIKSFLLLAALLCISPPVPLAATTAGKSEAKNIVSNLHITGFAQDAFEVMWIATTHGLCRYNGYEYIHYFHDRSDPNSMPSDFTSSVYIDKANTMWITTDKGVCRYNSKTDDFSACSFGNDSLKPSFEHACLEFQDMLLVCGMNGIKTVDRSDLSMERLETTSAYILQTMIEDDYYQLWAGGMMGQGIVCLNKELSVITRIPLDASVDIFCSYKADDGSIWFGTNQGVVVVNPISKKIVPGPFSAGDSARLSKLRIKFFHKSGDNTLLLGTENSNLLAYDLFTREISSAVDFLPDNRSVHLTCCYTDRDSNIWLGTFDNGYYMVGSTPARFNNDKSLNELFKGKFVTRIIEDREGNLWVGTRYDGLIFYDTATRKHKAYDMYNFPPFSAANTNLVENLYLDSSGNLWVGLQSNIFQCKVREGNIESYKVLENWGPSIFMEDDYHRLWIGSSADGVTVYDTRKTDAFTNIRFDNKWNNITCIIKLRSGEMLISAYDDGIYVADPNDMSVKHLEIPAELSAALDRTISLFEDSKGNIWTGSYGKGSVKYNRNTGDYRIYMRQDGLPDNNVLAVTEDGKGDIWMSTSYGITRLNTGKETFSSFFDYDGTGGNQFHEKSVFRSPGDRIYFGGNHGITYFDAKDIIPLNGSVPVLLEDLKILNVSEPIGRKKGVLKAHISQTRAITLNHRQNVFSIDYSGVDFSSSKNIKYAYRLRNFDNDWNYVGDYRRATYSNLAPGLYHFEVKAQNRDGYWSEMPTALDIRVKAAPWRSTWAMTGYILLVMLSLFACLRVYINIRINRERLGMMVKEHELEKEVAEMKINFFTNISHELRTPLSMIYGPIKQLRSSYGDKDTAKYLMDLVNFNVDNILRLIDQLMDFGKIESDTLSLSVGHTDVGDVIGKLVDSYSFYAREKNIELKLDAASDHLGDLLADRDKITKITGNLLSNALKYTPFGGSVIVRLDVADELPSDFQSAGLGGSHLIITVIDDGVGMNKEDLKHLFKRYKRFTYNDDYSKNVDGKGIGLHYVKRLVDKHKGKIAARQGEGGRGMVFTVALPVDGIAYSDDELRTSDYLALSVRNFSFANQGMADMRGADGNESFEILPDRRTVMVVEDNAELRLFLARTFREYNVVCACDGEEAAGMFGEFDIDVVISDILMPKMDGLELCSHIKNDPALCHIPVILLTAKTMHDDQVQGYSEGADLYVVKPFDPAMLLMIIRNMFTNLDRRSRLILHNRAAAEDELSISIGDSKALPMNPLDRKFLDRLNAMIDQEISNSHLNINAMGKEMAFSRTSFYRKIKALTGESPYGFLRVYRLNRAAELLLTQEYTISEIVDMVGFGTHSHFSACFKKQFGVSPKSYTGDKHD